MQQNEKEGSEVEILLISNGQNWISQAADPTTCKYGKYMQKIPDNPFNDLNTVSTSGTKITGQGSDLTGWHFVTSGVDAGLFQANDDDANPFDPTEWHTGY